jgi:Prokaryotic E2 family C/ThiF family
VALADYYDRAALAAAQVIVGFNEQAFRNALEATTIGVSLDEHTSAVSEGRILSDLVVRLLARLYPRLQLAVADSPRKADLSQLARAINPQIELVDSGAEVGIAVGEKATQFPTTVFAGSEGWSARVGLSAPASVGDSRNPFGAGAAAGLAAATVFRALFAGGSRECLDENVAFSTWSGECGAGNDGPSLPQSVQLPGDAVLVGLGAVGHGVLWALGRSPLAGRLHVVDPERIELSNLQRYAFGQRSDDGRPKTEVAESALAMSGLKPVSHTSAWAEFVDREGYDWPFVLVAVDSAHDRRAVQAALPGWIANAWTQPGDLGVSAHSRFGSEGACVSCLYLPSGPAPNEDELVAQALGVPDRQQQIRNLLYHGAPVPADLFEAISAGLDVPIEALRQFAGRGIRELYVQGLCGGALIGLERLGKPVQEVHVPLAHQSALAGVLLASTLARHVLNNDEELTRITRIDVLQPLGSHLTQPAKAGDPRCICRDADYVSTFEVKWPDL